MYFTMVDHVVDGKTYPRRVGVMTPSFKQASAKAVSRKGYVVDESNHIIGQAMSPFLPKYIGTDMGEVKGRSINNRLINISSGEDAYV